MLIPICEVTLEVPAELDLGFVPREGDDEDRGVVSEPYAIFLRLVVVPKGELRKRKFRLLEVGYGRITYRTCTACGMAAVWTVEYEVRSCDHLVPLEACGLHNLL